MIDAVCPIKAELAENELENLEMVVLLVSYDIDVLIKAILCETLLRCTEVLSHVYRCTVTTEKELAVETVCCKVTPDRSVLLSLEDACLKTLLYECLAEKICLRLIVCPVEADTEVAVCLVEALIYPAVHCLPKLNYLSITVFPFEEHLLRRLE